MQGQQPTVYVIDDDPSVRDGLDSLLRSVGYDARVFASPRNFLTSPPSEGPACIVLDVRMPDASGLDFQDELARTGYAIPIIFLTGHGDVPMSVRAMKAGAVEFLLKPFREQDLLDAIRQALEIDRIRLRKQAAEVDLHERFSTLTPREREVMALVARGSPQQADRCRDRSQRNHRQGPPRSGHAQDAGRLRRRPHPDGG